MNTVSDAITSRTTRCAECDGALDHCHGTLVVHSTDIVECTDGECEHWHLVRHSLVVDCSVIAGGCSCAEADLFARAS